MKFLAAVWDGDASADVRHSSFQLHHHSCPEQTKVVIIITTTTVTIIVIIMITVIIMTIIIVTITMMMIILSMRSPTNIVLLSMAVCDLLTIALPAPW